MDYIYESPDKGNTIYRRKFGSKDRELVKTVDMEEKYQKELKEIVDKYEHIFKHIYRDRHSREAVPSVRAYI